ncbi:CREB-regulated transcription coactivator 2-like [Carassius carassius]|uniref:CREB-regulated transcription coactivator 2-like n=1 Tax=Carassius carassius TaxID=217509 RepID=UPI0028684404|nr:CREB-regulated transcription coactivator 2-like [Carassius carassius]
MHLSGAGIGKLGYRQGSGAGPAPGSCNPRKFSEKIALHNQRQAEDTAAFREVMMDMTSIRVQAERIRHTGDLVPYYGGSLPNVNQISRCSTETQYPSYLTQQLLEADEEYRDTQPIPLGRLHRRHFESAPYLSTHLSPPRGPSWRSWKVKIPTSPCSAHLISHSVHPHRTNSDSALHTSVRNTQKSVQTLNPQSRHHGFAHPAPLIEENIQEETQSPQLKKLSSMGSSGYETPFFHSFPLTGQQISSVPVPATLSTSGSLPDLSSLHLPPPLPVGQDSELRSGAEQLSNTSTHPDLMADFTLASLSSSLQASLSNPLLQSSLSNPNIQSCLSSHSLPSSLRSTSLRLSLSNSSLQSSLSNQSLQSSLSSSSLSNQSVHSSASRCSHSSGIGSSRSCSSSSLSGSPHLTGHTHAATSRKRAQLSPLIVPSGGETRWQHPKQFSPTLSPTRSSGALLNHNKVLKETKPPAYPCTQHFRSAPSLSHQPMRQYFQPEAQHQSIPEMEQWSQDEHQSQHQQTHSQTRHHHTHKHSRPLQHHSQPHTNYHQQLLHHSQTGQPHISLQQQHQQYTQFQPHQILEEQYQCPGQWQMPCQEVQYQKQQQHQPVTFPSPGHDKNWNHVTGPHGLQHAQMKRRHCMQMSEEPKLLSKVAVQETHGKGSKVPYYKESEVTEANPGLQDRGFELNKESYVGLHLTPSQAKALSQQLGVLQKETLDGSVVSDLNCEPAERKELLAQNQSYSAGETQNMFNINLPDPSSWLDQDISSLPDSVLEFDLETFGLDSNLGWP